MTCNMLLRKTETDVICWAWMMDKPGALNVGIIACERGHLPFYTEIWKFNTQPARDPVRQIDWRKEAGDANLCKEFGVAAHNRSKTLCDKLQDKNSSAVYCKQRCNTGVAPKKSEMMLTYASNEMVTRAKQDLKLAAQKHQSGPARNFCNDANIQKSNRESPQTLQSLCCKRNVMFNRLRSLTTSATQYCLTEFPFILNLLKLQIICRFADCFSVPAVPVRG